MPTNTPGATDTPGTPATAEPTASATDTPSPDPTAVQQACTISFSDVLPGNPFYASIICMACSGYVCGGPGEPCDSQNRPYFRPGNNATRGQASKILANSFYIERSR